MYGGPVIGPDSGPPRYTVPGQRAAGSVGTSSVDRADFRACRAGDAGSSALSILRLARFARFEAVRGRRVQRHAFRQRDRRRLQLRESISVGFVVVRQRQRRAQAVGLIGLWSFPAPSAEGRRERRAPLQPSGPDRRRVGGSVPFSPSRIRRVPACVVVCGRGPVQLVGLRQEAAVANRAFACADVAEESQARARAEPGEMFRLSK